VLKTPDKIKKQEDINLKKYLALILGVLFVLSFAASAFAIHAEIPSETQAVVAKSDVQITLGGEIRVRGWWKDKVNSANLPTKDITSAYYDERVRLSLDAAVAPGIKGFVMFETNGGTNPSQSDVYTWGSFNQKPNSMNINEAWLLYSGSGLLGFNSGLKIGHMPLALGQKEFFDHTKFGDDAIVFFMDPTKQIHVGLLTIKFAEGSKSVSGDDLDGYVGLMTYKIDDKNTVGINYTYLNQSNAGFSHQNLGLHANGNISGIGYMATGDIQFGKVGDGTPLESDFKGYALQLGLDYGLSPEVKIRGALAYGSGDDDLGDNDIDTFVTYLGNDQHYTLIYEYLVTSAAGSINTGLSNTGYINLGLDWKATKDLGLSIDGYWLQASEDNPITKSDEIGWEVDGKIKYALAKNLTYQIDAGYFDAGDLYGNDAKGVTVLRHLIQLNF